MPFKSLLLASLFSVFSRFRLLALYAANPLFIEVGESLVRLAWLAPSRPNGPVRLQTCQLLTPNEDVEEALTFREAAGLVERTERALLDVTKEFALEPLGLLVQLALQPDGGLGVQYQSTKHGMEELYRAIDDALSRQYWPLLPGGKIEIEMQFSLWG